MGDFREMAENWAILDVWKNLKLLKHGQAMHHFEALGLGISNILFVSRNV